MNILTLKLSVINSSEGCPYNCGFCCEVSLWKRKWSAASAEKIYADIYHLMTTYGVNGIKFFDSEFFIDHNRVIKFANMLINNNLSIKWGASIHPFNLIKMLDKLPFLKKSGLTRLLVGIESADESERMTMGK